MKSLKGILNIIKIILNCIVKVLIFLAVIISLGEDFCQWVITKIRANNR